MLAISFWTGNILIAILVAMWILAAMLTGVIKQMRFLNTLDHIVLTMSKILLVGIVISVVLTFFSFVFQYV